MNTEEINATIEHAIHGNWVPFGIVVACLGTIVLLFVYILKMKDKANTSDHETMNDLLSKLVESNVELVKMTSVHEAEIKNLK